MDRIEAQDKLMATDLEPRAAGARRDVMSYRFIPGFAGLMRARMSGGADLADGVPASVWRARIGMHFTAELEAKPAYAMIRLIGVDDNQREIIRVDPSSPDGAVRVVPDPGLRGRGHRYYFKETVGLLPGQNYVSPVKLDHQETRNPRTPMLRIGTPIIGPDGKPFAILVLNVDMNLVF